MLKIVKNDISNIKMDGNSCTPYTDCTAHDAAAEDLAIAKSNLVTAKNNLTNAQTLQSNLETEKANTAAVLDNYKNVYDALTSVGPSVANPGNMNELSGAIDCLCTYGSNVEQAYNQAVSEVARCEAEVARCETEVQQAQTKLNNTPCVTGCR